MDLITTEVRQLFSDWQRNLVPGSASGSTQEEALVRQQELEDVVEKGPMALALYLRDQLGIDRDAVIEAPLLPRILSPAEFRDPPFTLERGLYESWRSLVQPGTASQPLYWTLCHVRWLEDGQLGDQIDVSLLQGGRDGTAEARTRNLLRRLGGLAHVRGKISVLVNCPLGRAWWRGHVGSMAAEKSSGALTSETAHRVLHARNAAWEKLVGDSVYRITVSNRPEIRAALVHHYREASREAGDVNADEMQRTARVLARHGSSLASDLRPWSELVELTEAAAQTAKQELAAEAQ